MAARQRRQAAEDSNKHSPPAPEDVWICEFCEYERIFGEPPRALLRNYETKDRRHRQEEADRKRVMEKAKAKSRKSKKSGKIPNKSGPSGHQHPDHGHQDFIDNGAPSMNQSQSHSTQSEENYDGGYGEGHSIASQTGHADLVSNHAPHQAALLLGGRDAQDPATT